MISTTYPTSSRARVLATCLIALMLLISTGLAGGQRASAAPLDTVSITLTDVDPVVISDDDSLTLSGDITNNGEGDLNDVTVWFRMQTHVTNDMGLTEWLDGEAENNVVTMARLDLEKPIKAGRRAHYSLTIPPEESPFDRGSQWGPRGVEMVVVANDSDTSLRVSASARSTIFWYPEDASPEGAATPTPVAVAVPLTATVEEWKTALDEQTPVGTVASTRISDITANLTRFAVTWGVDAALLDPNPPDQTNLFTTGEHPEESTESESSTGLDSTPETNDAEESSDSREFIGNWNSGDVTEITEQIVEATGGRTPVSLGWARPDLPSLLDSPGSLHTGDAPGAMLFESNVSRSHKLFNQAGIAINEAILWPFTHVGANTVSQLPEEVTDVIAPVGSTASSLISPISSRVTVHTPSSNLTDLIMSDISEGEFLARIALAVQAKPDTPLLITLPATLTGDEASQVAENLETLDLASWLSFKPFEAGQNAVGLTGLRPLASGLLNTSEVSSLADYLATVSSFASLTDEGEKIEEIFGTSVLLATSMVWREEPAPRSDLISHIEAAAGSLDTFLQIESLSTVNLISKGGDLPVSIVNTGPVPLHPRIELHPSDSRLRAQPVDIELPPDRSTTVRIPITAIANGNVTASIHVLNADGTDVAEPEHFTVRVRADWETTGTAIMAGLVLVAFLFGVFHNIRSANLSGRHPRRHYG